MRYIHSIAVLNIKGKVKQVKEYLTKGYYLHKIIVKNDSVDYSVAILNIDRESIMTIGRMFVPTHIIYGGTNDDISNLVREYGLGEWIEGINAHLLSKFSDIHTERLIRESINAAPFRRYMCRGMLYCGFKI